jgi:hypothetical protein
VNREDVADRPRSCPRCKSQFDSACGLNTGGRPETGDLTLCIRCGAVCFFTDEAPGMRLLTEDEITALDPETFALIDSARKRILRQ